VSDRLSYRFSHAAVRAATMNVRARKILCLQWNVHRALFCAAVIPLFRE
jgi:hypothetical protein